MFLFSKICLNSGNTTNLLKHLELVHAEKILEPEKQHPQPSISRFLTTQNRSSTPLPTSEQEPHTNNLQKFLVTSLIPSSAVQDPSFTSFIKGLQPRYQVPARKTIMDRMQTCFNSLRYELKAQLKCCTDVAITHDSWPSCANENYETVTIHFIDDFWEMKGKVLETKKISGSHTAAAIKEYLTDVMQRWSLSNITAVSDNASVEIKAFQDLQWPRIACIGHTINLVVKKSLSGNAISRAVGKGRNLVSYFHKSPLATGYLKEKQKLVL